MVTSLAIYKQSNYYNGRDNKKFSPGAEYLSFLLAIAHLECI